ncbi:unnamed protein product [Chondrus crispus]|uniref:Secreted protein n=1 Tax=Chondrus crispus TaxID=2769 RepID=R7Q5E1_CHOCR|nr:unnamed protein product [Chondrus crispus]CDF32680.1 unnamed protein product [Chondrus crispus]|eukprot:XP_005712451.1 unnamed protein product [Chondrus crispus]
MKKANAVSLVSCFPVFLSFVAASNDEVFHENIRGLAQEGAAFLGECVRRLKRGLPRSLHVMCSCGRTLPLVERRSLSSPIVVTAFETSPAASSFCVVVRVARNG